jgi:hypothetical protein
VTNTSERAALLLRMVAEATRNDILNPETIINALANQLTISDLVLLRVAVDLIESSYEKVLRENGNDGQRMGPEDSSDTTVNATG